MKKWSVMFSRKCNKTCLWYRVHIFKPQPYLSSSRKWKTSVLSCYNRCETEFPSRSQEISTSGSLCLWVGKITGSTLKSSTEYFTWEDRRMFMGMDDMRPNGGSEGISTPPHRSTAAGMARTHQNLWIITQNKIHKNTDQWSTSHHLDFPSYIGFNVYYHVFHFFNWWPWVFTKMVLI